MKLTIKLRAHLGVGDKYSLSIIAGNSAPTTHHEDAYRTDRDSGKVTKYAKSYRGKWNTYHAAVNEVQVGREWINRAVPGWVPNRELTAAEQHGLRAALGEFRSSEFPKIPTDADRWNHEVNADYADYDGSIPMRDGWGYKDLGRGLIACSYSRSIARDAAEYQWAKRDSRLLKIWQDSVGCSTADQIEWAYRDRRFDVDLEETICTTSPTDIQIEEMA